MDIYLNIYLNYGHWPLVSKHVYSSFKTRKKIVYQGSNLAKTFNNGHQ